MSYKLRILSLGAGVQSSTILLMACKGLIPKPDAAIFADTGWETLATHQHLEWLKIEAGKYGVPVVIVGREMSIYEHGICCGLRDNYTMGVGFTMPVFTNISGKKGMTKRQCTTHFKIKPIKDEIRKMLGLKPKQWAPKDCVEQWIGISTDEAQRIFTRHKSRESVLRYPLLELNMSRYDCMVWLKKHYDIIVPKSSCIGCPFHSNKEWRALSEPEFMDACLFDEAIRRKGGYRSDLYLHRSCVPLSEVDFRTAEDMGQQVFDFCKDEKLNLFVNNLSIVTA